MLRWKPPARANKAAVLPWWPVKCAAWPPGERRSALPEAVILELELADHGTLTRFIALR